jgi:hypothetical protein
VKSGSSDTFKASYDNAAKWISAAVFFLLAVLTAVIPSAVVGPLAALLLLGAYAWSPRSYTITGRSIIVKRLIGSVRIPLDRIQEARIATPDDFRDCYRLFGNGGLFGYYGKFSTAKLGRCTWYVTNQSNAVVVITAAGTTVFSPDDVDGFLGAVREAVPVPTDSPREPLLNSLQSYDAGVPPSLWVGGFLAVVVLVIVALAMLYSPGPPDLTLTAGALTIRDRFYPVTVQAGSVDVDHIRLIDAAADTEWRPTARTNGFANGHYQSGWFRVAGGRTVRLYRAGGKRLVLLPPKGDGTAILLESSDPERFVREVRQAWGGGSRE